MQAASNSAAMDPLPRASRDINEITFDCTTLILRSFDMPGHLEQLRRLVVDRDASLSTLIDDGMLLSGSLYPLGPWLSRRAVEELRISLYYLAAGV